MSNIRNFTPHVLNVVLPSGDMLFLTPEGTPIRAAQETTVVGYIAGIPVQVISFGAPQGVPSVAADDILVVSQLAAQAIANHLPHLATQVVIPGPLDRTTGTISCFCRL